jgi:hypothetical protein
MVAFTKKYEQWEKLSWVRNGQRFFATEAGLANFDLFPRGLVPYSGKLEQRLGPAAVWQALTQCLYGYLRFTEQLELKSVNQVGHRIALGELSVPVSRDMRSRAFLLVRDEAHHATASDDVACQIEHLTGVPPLDFGEPQFLRNLQEIAQRCSLAWVHNLEAAFATISETLISGSLAQLPRDTTVLPLVRDYAEAHKVDEGRHQTYFTEFFGEWWPQLPERERRAIGPHLPDLCLAFLRPDYRFHQQVLEAVGVGPLESLDWVLEAFPENELGEDSRRPLQATLKLFERTGVFTDAATSDAFAARGLRD